MTLQDLLQKEFGVKTIAKINPIISSIGTDIKRVLDNNPNRLAWTIINLSSNDLYLGFDNDVSSNKGVYVAANGGSASMLYRDDFDPTGWEIWGKASGAGSNIYVIEIVTAE